MPPMDKPGGSYDYVSRIYCVRLCRTPLHLHLNSFVRGAPEDDGTFSGGRFGICIVCIASCFLLLSQCCRTPQCVCIANCFLLLSQYCRTPQCPHLNSFVQGVTEGVPKEQVTGWATQYCCSAMRVHRELFSALVP